MCPKVAGLWILLVFLAVTSCGGGSMQSPPRFAGGQASTSSSFPEQDLRTWSAGLNDVTVQTLNACGAFGQAGCDVCLEWFSFWESPFQWGSCKVRDLHQCNGGLTADPGTGTCGCPTGSVLSDTSTCTPLAPAVACEDVPPRGRQLLPVDDASCIKPVDLMVLYTAAAKRDEESVNERPIREGIQFRVDELNEVFRNSGMQQRVRLVYAGPIDYDEGQQNNDPLDVLDALQQPGRSGGYLRESVRSLRTAIGADLASVIIGPSTVFGSSRGGACGAGALDIGESTGGFSAVSTKCRTPYVLAHEIGHNFGLRHDAATLGTPPSGTNIGYVDREHKFFTVMAYSTACPDCRRVGYWSTPDPTIRSMAADGSLYPVGTEQANNRQELIRNYDTVRNYNVLSSKPLMHPANVSFDQVMRGSAGTRVKIGVYNPTSQSFNVTAVGLEGTTAAPFVLLPGDSSEVLCEQGRVVKPREACFVYATLAPSAKVLAGDVSAMLRVLLRGDDGITTTVTSILQGRVVTPLLVNAGDPVDFGLVRDSVTAGEDLKIINTSASPLTLTRLDLANGSSFKLSAECTPDVICCHVGAILMSKDDACTVMVTFRSMTSGEFHDSLIVESAEAGPAAPVLLKADVQGELR